MSVDTPKNEGFNVPLDSTTAALVERASGSTSLENKIQFILEIIKREMRAIIEEREKTTFTQNSLEPTETMKVARETLRATPVPQFSEQEVLDHPLLQISGVFAIGEPGWADRHDEYLAETYQEDHANEK